MPTATQQQPPNQTATLGALTLILLAGQDQPTTAHYVTALLKPLGFPDVAIAGALSLLHPHVQAPGTVAPNTAVSYMNRTEAARSAAYLLNATQRLSSGGDVASERRYLAQHLDAGRIRQEVAQRIDAAARMFGPVLGWRSVLDSHTTPACRLANGKNFLAAQPPLIGYPGSLHGGSCRCLGGPPFADAQMVDQVVSHGV